MTSIRRTGAVSGATLSVLAMTLGLAHAVAPRWSERVGLDVWNYNAVRETAHEVEARGLALERESVKLRHEVELADHVTARVIEGKLALGDAADELASFLKDRPGFTRVREGFYKTPTLRHAAARYVIVRVGCLLHDDPDQIAIVTARLEAEFVALK